MDPDRHEAQHALELLIENARLELLAPAPQRFRLQEFAVQLRAELGRFGIEVAPLPGGGWRTPDALEPIYQEPVDVLRELCHLINSLDGPLDDPDRRLFQDKLARLVEAAEDALVTSAGDRPRLESYIDRLGIMIVQVEQLAPHLFRPEHLVATLKDLQGDLREVIERRSRSTASGTMVPVRLVHQGPGRPKVIFDPEWLQTSLVDMKLPLWKVAEMVEPFVAVSEKTVRRRALELGIVQVGEPARHYSLISDDELDDRVRALRRLQPDVGVLFARGALWRDGHYVQRQRIRDALNRCFPFREALRQAVVPRTYRSLGPNACWHNDGQHGLVHFGIVIHAFVDGYSRVITAIRASTNN